MARAQLYCFYGPGAFEGEPEHIWCEMWLEDGQHVTVPTPFSSDMERALATVQARNPGAIVDELDNEGDIADALTYR